MQRILVLRGGALGDLIVTLPALAALKARWPGARVTLVGNARAGILARDAGLLDELISQHDAPWHQLYAEKLSPALHDRLAAFDLIVNFWPDPDADIARQVAGLGRTRYVAGDPRPGSGPAAKHFLAALRELALPPMPPIYALRQSHDHRRLIAVHPGSGSPRKNWAIDRWEALAKRIEAAWPGRLRVIRGEAEPDTRLAGFGEAWSHRPLPELADRLAECAVFIGHDSGVSHLAAACGCAGVLLFGPTDPEIWAPPTPRLTVLRHGAGLDRITVEDVWTALEAKLADRT